MIHTCLPCNSSARLDRGRCAPGCNEVHPARPSPGQLGRGTLRAAHLRSFPGTPQRLLPPFAILPAISLSLSVSVFSYFSSATSCLRSLGISGTGDCRRVIVFLSRTITLFFVPQTGSNPG